MVNLDKLNKNLDKALESETKESLEKWMNKLRVGDKVICKYSCAIICVIKDIAETSWGKIFKLLPDTNRNLNYQFVNSWYHEKYIKPYHEPKFKLHDKVVLDNKDSANYGKVCTITEYQWMASLNGWYYRFNEIAGAYAERTLKLYIEEMNLCEILKGHEGEEFYSLMHGNIRYMTNSAEGFVMFDYPESISLYPNGKYDDNAEVILYPSRESYLKYPLDAKMAWQEWEEEQKPKRWRAEKRSMYWYIGDDGFIWSVPECFNENDKNTYEFGNYFRTKELAQQAAEAVKECLMKFHEQHNQQ